MTFFKSKFHGPLPINIFWLWQSQKEPINLFQSVEKDMLESKQPHSNSYDTFLIIGLNKWFYESKWGYNSIVSQLLGLPSGSPTIAGCRLASTSDLKQCYSMRMGTHSHLYNIRNFFFVIWLLLVYSGTHYIFVFAPSLHCMALLSDKIIYYKYYKGGYRL